MSVRPAQQPLLTIGMPVYNGEKWIREAILSVCEQKLPSWRLIISNNASEDRTSEICKEFLSRDARIILVEQSSNIGGEANFREVLDRASTKYFMWLAADDVISKNYIEECVSRLEADEGFAYSSGGFKNIDDSGNIICDIPVTSILNDNRYFRVFNFLNIREVDGKANPIYSVFRTNVAKEAFSRGGLFSFWGGDMAFVMAALMYGKYEIARDATLFKRVVSASSVEATRITATRDYRAMSHAGNFPPREFWSYLSGLWLVCPNISMKILVFLVMIGRVIGVIAIENYLRSRAVFRKLLRQI